ncbi:PaaI family thioesterase [Antrihabitans stalactiti]|uniref:PaaI family thioesterase n=1 Tax=Antrihabitans stalactiti TaxID=2584121 RepID=A0A848KEW4_9NOCA|nr:PaaI family thioesterase [Antrihabitans stalactiti]
MSAEPLSSESIDQLNEISGRGFDGVIGLKYVGGTTDRLEAEIEVNPSLLQPGGIVHGGVYCAIVESAASVAGVNWLAGKGHAVGVNNNTDFLRATRSGSLSAVAEPIHRGKSQQLWVVTITDVDGRTVARGQVRLQNIYGDKELGK